MFGAIHDKTTANLLAHHYFEGYDIQIWPPTSPHLLKNQSNTKIIIFWGVGAEKEQINLLPIVRPWEQGAITRIQLTTC